MILAVTGHRPNKLGWGYNLSNPKYNILYQRIFDTFFAYSITHCISGMALGVDTVFAIASIKYRNQYPEKNIIVEAAVPCLNQEKYWNDKDQKNYKKILSKVDIVTYVSKNYYSLELMQKRNEYMVDKCDLLLAVWNRTKGGTYNCIQYAKKQNKQIIYIDPRKIE